MDKVRIFSIDIKCYIFFISTFFMLSSSSSKQYRTDYVYNSKTDAFYKFHMETAYYSQARILCTAEGASLMVPSSEEDVSQAHGLFKQYPDIGDLAWIGNDGNRHDDDDDDDEEVPIINLDYLHTAIEGDRWRGNTWNECHIMKRTGEVQRIRCLNVLPFICKVDAKDVIYNKQCKVFGKGYRYFENVGSCYKVPEQGFEWNKAYAECRAEGAHLVVLNSELERQVMYNITNEERHIVYNARVSWFFFAGIRAKKETDGSPIVFKTIFNQTLVEAGFSQWSENEPNNSKGKEYCGAIFKNDGKYNDIDCADQLAFICEKEVLNTSS